MMLEYGKITSPALYRLGQITVSPLPSRKLSDARVGNVLESHDEDTRFRRRPRWCGCCFRRSSAAEEKSANRVVAARTAWPLRSEFDLLRDGEGVVNLNAKVADRAFELGVPEQQLHSPQVSGPLVNLGHLGPPHRVGPVS